MREKLQGIKKARLDQKKIVEKVVAELSSSDRATVVMPCGTGKTLVALWVIERMKVKNVAIFAPSLGLLAQTAREFLENTRYRKVGCLATCIPGYHNYERVVPKVPQWFCIIQA